MEDIELLLEINTIYSGFGYYLPVNRRYSHAVAAEYKKDYRTTRQLEADSHAYNWRIVGLFF